MSESIDPANWCAGHAVVASALSVPLRRVSIQRIGASAAHVLYEKMMFLSREDVVDSLTCSLAGVALSHVLDLQSGPTATAGEELNQARQLAQKISDIFGDDVEKLLADAVDRASKILSERRKIVDAVAAALRRDLECSSDQIAAIVKQQTA